MARNRGGEHEKGQTEVQRERHLSRGGQIGAFMTGKSESQAIQSCANLHASDDGMHDSKKKNKDVIFLCENDALR